MNETQQALLITAIVMLAVTAIYGGWVGSYSRGYDHRDWHRPLAAIFGGISAVLFIAVPWIGFLT